MTNWYFLFITTTAITSTLALVVSLMWMKKFRDTVATALGETASQSLRNAQRFDDSIDKVIKRQNAIDSQLQALIKAFVLSQKNSSVYDAADPEGSISSATPTRTLH